jgi:hypothetical protein
MKRLALGMLGLMVIGASAAEARPAGVSIGSAYPWCAQYMLQSGPKNCGFTSFAQCLADVSGIGGTCAANPYFVPPQSSHGRRRHG